jgi:hypothetical protein
MPTVPIARNTVGIAQTTDAKLQAADFQPGGEMVGRAIEGLGEQGSRLAQAQHQYQERVNDWQDDAATKEAVNHVNGFYSDRGYTGSDPFFQKSGKAALEARPQFDKDLDTSISQARVGLKNDRQRRMFDDAVTPQRNAWGMQIATHAQKEARTYDDDQSVASIENTGELFRNTWISDPKHGLDQLATGVGQIEHRGEINGWSPERVGLEKLKFTSGAWKDVGTRLAYEGGADGPKLAETLVEKYGTAMTSDDRETVLTHARVQTNALEAEQRRQEAEDRRAAREAKQDARDRAQSVYRNIHDGVYVEPKALAAAIADAKTAADPALAEGLRQGGLQNSLTQQFADASPAELQDIVNEKSAEITRAHGKVSPDLIVERDHLQKLLDQSSAELRSDPMSWGAKHLGLALGALNFNQPDSINSRVDAAKRVHRATGAAMAPFTNEEAAQYATVANTGSVKEKTALAMSLAKLGPLALAGAQQVAPNNAGFQNLVGLASHQNRNVGASRVNQVVAGTEALKTMPKLIKRDEAVQQFNQFLGQSLMFLPTVKEGVLSNAAAIFANESAENGHAEWQQAKPRWYAAVNSALGAYTKNGVQYGGLSTFNGAATVLPENMSEADFEGRVSRATGTALRAAQNGVPVHTDGSSPTASDVKRMQWVPARDGVYRLTDGAGFLSTNEGGFYEIDVRKLSTLDAQLAAHGYHRY